MSTVVVVEIKRYGWSQKIIKKSFVIIGKSPYAKTLRLHDMRKRVLPHEKGARAWRISKCLCLRREMLQQYKDKFSVDNERFRTIREPSEIH
jgi:hypothetical protein